MSDNTYACPVCGNHIYEEYNSDMPRRCSVCGSLDRTRVFAEFFDKIWLKIGHFGNDYKILHVSPSNPEKLFFKNRGINTVSIDVRPELKTDIVADICNMPSVDSEYFDCFLQVLFGKSCKVKLAIRALPKWHFLQGWYPAPADAG